MCCVWVLLGMAFFSITISQDATMAHNAVLARIRDRLQFLRQELSTAKAPNLIHWAKPWETIRVLNTQSISIQYTLTSRTGHLLQTTKTRGQTVSMPSSLISQWLHANHGNFVYSPRSGHQTLFVFTQLLHRHDMLVASIPDNLITQVALQTLTRDRGLLGLFMVLITTTAAWLLARRLHHEFVPLLAVRSRTDADQVAQKSRVTEISQVAHSWAETLQTVTEETLRASWLATHDPLTGLLNRRGLWDRMTSRAEDPMPRTLAFILMDIDHFKHVNDTYGHGAGDQLLQDAGHAMLEGTRDYPDIARIGGDEFAILLESPSLNETTLTPLVQQIVSLVRSQLSVSSTSSPFAVTFSVGATIWSPNRTSIDETFYEADLALYASKDRGRDRITCYSEDLYHEAQAKSLMTKRVLEAISRRDFWFRYQPVVNLQSGEILGVEALLRWGQGQEEKQPEQFLPYIVDPDIMIQLEDYVLEEVIMQAHTWHEQGIRLSVGINISPQYFLSSTLPAKLEKLLKLADLPPQTISLEIIGNADLSHMAAAIQQIRRVQDREVAVAIDNFGTGYASLSYLLELPVNYIKLDPSFTAGVRPGSDSWIMVSGVVALCQAMGRKVITEAIETPLAASVLSNMGVLAGQGEWFGGPMTPDVLVEWLSVPHDTPEPNPARMSRNLVVMIPYQVMQWTQQVSLYAQYRGTDEEKERLLDQVHCLCGVWLEQLDTRNPKTRWLEIENLHRDMHHAARDLLGDPTQMTAHETFVVCVDTFLKRLYQMAAKGV